MTTERVDGEEEAASATTASPSPIGVLRSVLPQESARTLIGVVGDMLHVQGPTVVHGKVSSGLVVPAWCRVDVHGRVDGPVGLGVGAVLRVRGEFCGDVVTDEGLVVVSGQVSLAAARTGRVAFERGSLLVGSHGEGWWVDDDGAAVRTDVERHVEVAGGARGLLRCDPESGRFRPVLVSTSTPVPVS